MMMMLQAYTTMATNHGNDDYNNDGHKQ